MKAFAAVCLALFANVLLADGSKLRFEAEDVTVTQDAWAVNRSNVAKWNLWSTDQDADKKWSEGVVLQSPRVLKDRGNPEDGAPPLHSIVEGIPAGGYYVEIGGVGRPMGISLDGVTWRKIDGASRTLGPLQIKDRFEIWIDDRYASTTNPGSCYYDYLEFTPLPDPNRKPKVRGFASQRIDERLDRGCVVLPMGDGRNYVGWRLLKTDPGNIAFHVYRTAEGHPATRVTTAPITQTTDFVDEHPWADVENEYHVVAESDGAESDGKQGPASPSVRVKTNSDAQTIFRFRYVASTRFRNAEWLIWMAMALTISSSSNPTPMSILMRNIGSRVREPTRSKRIGRMAHFYGVTILAGQSNKASGTRRWSSAIWTGMGERRSA